MFGPKPLSLALTVWLALACSLRLPAAPDPAAADLKIDNIMAAPESPSEWPAWRERLAAWRQETKAKINYDDRLYRRSEFAWAQSCFSCCFVMVCDETFFDWQQGRFTVESFLNHGLREFGGYDAIVLWHAYPRIGFDDRNQFDFYRNLPGGLPGLREVSRVCHARGVKVFVDYNPWDTGTRREGLPDLDALAALVQAIDADGIFLDTMDRGAAEFRAKLDAVRPGVVLEGEGALPLENLHDHHLSWAQWFKDSPAPGVLRNKWFERRHVQHSIRRWDRDHTGELHTAWMNGSGMMVWENVFGSWVGWSARDRSILRAMVPIQRRYAGLFCGERWTPLVPTETPQVNASLWEGEGVQFWTLVNRSEKAVEGRLLTVKEVAGARYFDLIQGRELTSANQSEGSRQQSVQKRPPDGTITFFGTIPPHGIAAFVAGGGTTLGKDFSEFLAAQAKLEARADFSTNFPARTARLAPLPPARETRRRDLPLGMAAIPAATLDLKTIFRVRECGFYESQPEAGGSFPRLHQPLTMARKVTLAPYAIDLTPVSNAQFAQFLKASGYQPQHPENFLKHWQNGAPPPGQEDHPVVYVSLEDARAYAAWAGKRLPSEEEWQFAAAGPEQRRYPWGDDVRVGVCNDGSRGGTTPVTAFPEGRSPFGCFDLCGNVWHWTESERRDGRTRFCILKGGSFYRARGSDWYADGGPQPCQFATKFLLTWPGLDRCATIGFRCVADIE
ncbi:MAG: SUMF1/EgtB/PvdO family nonheme iron enzyme [Verrucomicrobiota bacterium]